MQFRAFHWDELRQMRFSKSRFKELYCIAYRGPVTHRIRTAPRDFDAFKAHNWVFGCSEAKG